jgi:polyribonucleotide nucleotidyltransferase
MTHSLTLWRTSFARYPVSVPYVRNIFIVFLFTFQGFNMETGVNCNLLSVDGVNDPEVLSINATSAAVALSDIPWGAPAVGAVRLGLLGGQVLVNPTRRQLSQR